MISLPNSTSRLIAVTNLLVFAASLSTAHGFSIRSQGGYMGQRSRSSSLFARPSKSALNFSEENDDLSSHTVEWDEDITNSLPPKQSQFFFPPHKDIDLHGLEQLAPLERHMLRMEGLDPYVIVSVLTSTTSYNTICGIDLFQNGSLDLISTLLMASSTISTICGVYATAVFSMSILYGKTALGLAKEDMYYKFMESTRVNRARGYKSFSLSLLLFVVDIFLISIDKLPVQAQGPAAIVGFATTFFGYKEFMHITRSAMPMFDGFEEARDDKR